MYFLGNAGDSNLTERNSRRSGAGVFGVDCTSVGSDLNWFDSLVENSRRMGCGVPPGDQIPIIHQTHMGGREREKSTFNLHSIRFPAVFTSFVLKACVK